MGKPKNIMSGLSRQTIFSLGTYTITNFFGKGVAFLLLPYFTNNLTTSDMGLLNLYSSSVLFLMPFVSLGVLQSINADFFKLDKKDFRDAFTSSLLLPIVVLLLAFLGFYLFRGLLYEKYKFPPAFIWVIPAVTFLSFIGEHAVNMVRNNNLPKTYMAVFTGRLFIEISLAVILISLLKYGWEGRVSGIMVSYLCMAVFAFIFFYRKGYIWGTIRKKVIVDELKYSIPIIVMQFSVFCMNASDSFFLSRNTNDNNAEVGIYGIACIFGSIILTLCSALLQYMVPKVYSLLSESTVNYNAIRKIFWAYAGIMFGGLILLLLLIPLAYLYVINKSYMPGLHFYYFLCTGYFFWAIAYFFYSFLLYNKQKKKIFLLSVCSIIISLGMNYFFIRSFKSMGAAVSVCSSYFIVLLITIYFTKNQLSFLFLKTKSN